MFIISHFKGGVNMTPYKKATEWYHCDCTKKKRRIRMPVLKSQFTLRLNLADHAKIKKIAEAENRSMTNMIEMLIKREIKRFEQENGEIMLTDDEIYAP